MTKEHELMDNIRIELSKHGIRLFRGNVGVLYTADGRRMSTGLPKGFPDLFGTLPNGRSVYIEVKVKPNRPTPEQLTFIDFMKRQGAAAGVAYSVEEAKRICGILRN